MAIDRRLGGPEEASLAADLYRRWQNGASKSELEERFLGTGRAHGKRFTALVRRHLGVETERAHPLVEENQRLRQLLREHGIDPSGGVAPRRSALTLPERANTVPRG